jgi:hypothetical protein
VRAAAARRVAEGEAAAVLGRWQAPDGAAPGLDVLAELARLAGRLVSLSDYLTAHLGEMDAAEWAAPSAMTEAKLRMWHVTAGQAGRMLTEISRLGLDEAAVARRVGLAVAMLTGRVLDRLGVPSGADEVREALAAEVLVMPEAPWELAGPGP